LFFELLKDRLNAYLIIWYMLSILGISKGCTYMGVVAWSYISTWTSQYCTRTL